VRVGAAVWWQNRLGEEQQFGFPDSESYWHLGQTIAAGKPYEFGEGGARMFRTPGYPVLLSTVFTVGGSAVNVLWARVLNAIIGTLTIGGVAWITDQLFNRKTALVAAMLAALYPGAIGMSVFVLAEGPFCLLMVLQIGCWVLWRTQQTSRPNTTALLIGVFAGLAILVRPSWMLFLPAAIALDAGLVHQQGKRWGCYAIMLLALVVTMLPWWVRNYAISGKFIATTSQVGASFYDGQGPQATGASDMRFVGGFEYAQRMTDRQNDRRTSLFEVRLDDRMRQAALDQIALSPSRVLSLASVKFTRMWSFTPNDAMFRKGPAQLAVTIGYAPLIVLALIGLVRQRKQLDVWLACALPAMYFTIIHAIFAGSIRYRQPPMLLLIVPAAAVLFALGRTFAATMSPNNLTSNLTNKQRSKQRPRN
jgi:4-amino-4-deoxy-L-arabinose transferase-like glycosyltransferase